MAIFLQEGKITRLWKGNHFQQVLKNPTFYHFQMGWRRGGHICISSLEKSFSEMGRGEGASKKVKHPLKTSHLKKGGSTKGSPTPGSALVC